MLTPKFVNDPTSPSRRQALALARVAEQLHAKLLKARQLQWMTQLIDQSRYVEQITNIKNCINRANESATMHDRLFAALQARAFQGDL